jgi:hypothetical protein
MLERGGRIVVRIGKHRVSKRRDFVAPLRFNHGSDRAITGTGTIKRLLTAAVVIFDVA